MSLLDVNLPFSLPLWLQLILGPIGIALLAFLAISIVGLVGGAATGEGDRSSAVVVGCGAIVAVIILAGAGCIALITALPTDVSGGTGTADPASYVAAGVVLLATAGLCVVVCIRFIGWISKPSR